MMLGHRSIGETPSLCLGPTRVGSKAGNTGPPLSSVFRKWETAVAMRGSTGVRWREVGQSRLHRPVGAFHRRDDRMNNLVIAFIAVAVAQALQLLLTIIREREIKRLRKLVAEQSRLMAERVQHGGQPRKIADREPIADDTRVSEPAITPKDLPDTIPSRTIEEEAARVVEVIDWLNEAQSTQPQRMRPDDDQPMADVPAPATAPKALHDRPRLTEHEIKEMVGSDKAREIFAVLHGTPPRQKIG